jgi:hypothetical protein
LLQDAQGKLPPPRFALHLAERAHHQLFHDLLSSHLPSARWKDFTQLVTAGVKLLRRDSNRPTLEALNALHEERLALNESQVECLRLGCRYALSRVAPRFLWRRPPLTASNR